MPQTRCIAHSSKRRRMIVANELLWHRWSDSNSKDNQGGAYEYAKRVVTSRGPHAQYLRRRVGSVEEPLLLFDANAAPALLPSAYPAGHELHGHRAWRVGVSCRRRSGRLAAYTVDTTGEEVYALMVVQFDDVAAASGGASDASDAALGCRVVASVADVDVEGGMGRGRRRAVLCDHGRDGPAVPSSTGCSFDMAPSAASGVEAPPPPAASGFAGAAASAAAGAKGKSGRKGKGKAQGQGGGWVEGLCGSGSAKGGGDRDGTKPSGNLQPATGEDGASSTTSSSSSSSSSSASTALTVMSSSSTLVLEEEADARFRLSFRRVAEGSRLLVDPGLARRD